MLVEVYSLDAVQSLEHVARGVSQTAESINHTGPHAAATANPGLVERRAS